ncbi:hypothetical protein J5N97_026772 [Dioscorea zingiberensis]|uniref:Protein kinase domain-containing protein n=1 Tax=Dioscorea zingiberensis TaxID=325984 RepID=A0A9D5C3R8_9LILI|nr:hypothetical protein J5N97_026772 [Dioscorea zingiberensis]
MSAEGFLTSWIIVVIVILCLSVVGGGIKIYFVYKYFMKHGTNTDSEAPTNTSVEIFLNGIAREKPIRFTRQQLADFTGNYATRLGSGGFGAVYKGKLPNEVRVAVKVLNGDLDYKSAEEQFMAEMGTIGRTFHANLVRIHGFCFDSIMSINADTNNPNHIIRKWSTTVIIITCLSLVATAIGAYSLYRCFMKHVESFLNKIAQDKPIRFAWQQFAGFTHKYRTRLGSGGFGAVYKGKLPNEVPIAVKVFNEAG